MLFDVFGEERGRSGQAQGRLKLMEHTPDRRIRLEDQSGFFESDGCLSLGPLISFVCGFLFFLFLSFLFLLFCR